MNTNKQLNKGNNVKKAILSSECDSFISFKHIEILNKDCGMPIAVVRENNDYRNNLQISISHDQDYATATAVLEIK